MKRWDNLAVLFLEDQTEPLESAVNESMKELGIPPHLIAAVLVDTGRPDREYRISQGPLVREEIDVLADVGCHQYRCCVWEGADDVEDVGRMVGELCHRHHCHVAVVDLQLQPLTDRRGRIVSDGSAATLQAGVLIARQLYRDFGVRNIVWRTHLANGIRSNPKAQVMRQVDVEENARTIGSISLIECPRSYLADATRSAHLGTPSQFTLALREIHTDIFERLKIGNVEWRAPVYQIVTLRRLMTSRGGVKHGLEDISVDVLDEVGGCELIPYFDPPTPFGLWLQTRGEPAGDRDAPGALFSRLCDIAALQEGKVRGGLAAPADGAGSTGEERGRLAKRLTEWLDVNLWGLPLELVHEVIDHEMKHAASVKRHDHLDFAYLRGGARSQPVEGDHGSRMRGLAVSPCCRYSVLTAVGNIIANAKFDTGRPRDTQISVDSTIIDADSEGSQRFVVVVANQIPDADGLLGRIVNDEVRARGLVHIRDAIEGMNRLESEGRRSEPWGFHWSVWEDGKCTTARFEYDDSAVRRPPWCVGYVPPSILNGELDLLRSMASAGTWAVAVLSMPVISTSSGGTNVPG